VMWIAAGLHNLRIQYRNGLINNSWYALLLIF
jgi:hypothetical protein